MFRISFAYPAALLGGLTLFGCGETGEAWTILDESSNPAKPGDASVGPDAAVTSDASGVTGSVDAAVSAVTSDVVATERDSGVPATCGNGILESGEQCDDGNDRADDACVGCSVVPRCGNGVVEPGEACDVLDAAVCDHCEPVVEPECGNGIVEGDEECDTDHESCIVCKLYTPVCGDGVINADDDCDDGNDDNEDGCDNLCRVRECGDGVVQEGEGCDPPGATCTNECQVVSELCGDGNQDSGEQCDDGNTATGDGCVNCMHECGDGVVDPQAGEACEPGKAKRRCRSSEKDQCFVCSGNEACDTRDTCSAQTCQPTPVCGNGVIETAVGEECDPPGSVTCDRDCKLIPAECGNETTEADEQCDPPDGVTCSETCTHLGCGNGTVEGAEQCEPPSLGDCDATCKWVPACVPSGPSNMLPESGNFDVSLAGWTSADTRVTLVRDAEQGNVAPGAMLITLDNGAAGGVLETRGASLCLPVSAGAIYTFAGYYRFPEGTSEESATSVSLFMYNSPDCSGSIADPARGLRSPVTQDWTRYGFAINTSALTAAGSVAVRLDVWRPATLAKTAVMWDDVSLTTAEFGPACGNCQVDDGEMCDDGLPGDGDGCNATCQLEVCGNNLTDLGEECDDGNATYHDGCDPDCTFGVGPRACGFEMCTAHANACYNESASSSGGSITCGGLADCIQTTGCAGPTALAAMTSPDVLNCYCGVATGPDCMKADLANGMCKAEFEAALETTDPALVLQRIGTKYGVFEAAAALAECSQVPGFGTSESKCPVVQTCGDEVLQERALTFAGTKPGLFDGVAQSQVTCGELTEGALCYPAGSCGCLKEECDDGNADAGDGCDSQCFVERCGNGVLQSGIDPLEPVEECDDGNLVNGDGCSATCKFERVCGNGEAETGEECEDGNLDNGDGCDSRCFREECGNGRVQAGEECEPPNTAACDADCKKVFQDECTECVLRADIYADPNGMVGCFGRPILTESPAVPVNPDTNDSYAILNGTHCLDNEACSDLWRCIVDSRCMDGLGRSHECYCGTGVDARDCALPDFMPTGLCLAETQAAYEAQYLQPIDSNVSYLERWGELRTAPGGYAALGLAMTVGVTCIQGNAMLDEALCYAGVSKQDRVACSAGCFGEEGGLSITEVLTDECTAP